MYRFFQKDKVNTYLGMIHIFRPISPAFTISLYVNSAEYIPGISDGVGARVVIHDQNEMPLPEQTGFNVRPGSKTSVELTRVRRKSTL